jgi:hypothetical protein
MDALQPNFINPYETTICEIFVYMLKGTTMFWILLDITFFSPAFIKSRAFFLNI